MSSGPPVAQDGLEQADFGAMGWPDHAVYDVAIEPAQDHPGHLLVDAGYIVG